MSGSVFQRAVDVQNIRSGFCGFGEVRGGEPAGENQFLYRIENLLCQLFLII